MTLAEDHSPDMTLHACVSIVYNNGDLTREHQKKLHDWLVKMATPGYRLAQLPAETELGLLASLVALLRRDMLTTEPDKCGIASEEHYLLALQALDNAATHLRLADHFASRERANERLGR